MAHHPHKSTHWLQHVPPAVKVQLETALAIELLLSGSGGTLLAFRQGKINVSPVVMISLGMVCILLLALSGYFLWLSRRLAYAPVTNNLRGKIGKAWAALALTVLWYGFGGILTAFLLDNFFGWQAISLGVAVLVGLHLVPLADAFGKPFLLLCGALTILLGFLVRMAFPEDALIHAQILGIWINILLWTLALDQLREINKQTSTRKKV